MLDFILLYDFSCILFWCHLTPHLSNLEIVNVIYTMFSDICMIHCSCIWHQKDTIFAIHLTYSVWSGFNISVCQCFCEFDLFPKLFLFITLCSLDLLGCLFLLQDMMRMGQACKWSLPQSIRAYFDVHKCLLYHFFMNLNYPPVSMSCFNPKISGTFIRPSISYFVIDAWSLAFT